MEDSGIFPFIQTKFNRKIIQIKSPIEKKFGLNHFWIETGLIKFIQKFIEKNSNEAQEFIHRI